MPNHVTNVLEITGPVKSVEKFRFTVSTKNPVLMKYLEDLRDASIKMFKDELEKNPQNHSAQMDLKEPIEPSILDFNSTVPMPIPVSCTNSPARDDDEEFKQQAENLKLYGATDWYAWANKFWGTKWGAYGVQKIVKITDGLRYQFDTAWSIPHAWFLTTSKMFPNLTFIDSWHDEGGPAGRSTYQSGYLKGSVVITEHEWLMDWDEGYRNDYNAIVTGPYRAMKNAT
jgi:Ferredoxin-like domain in Api92-like protein